MGEVTRCKKSGLNWLLPITFQAKSQRKVNVSLLGLDYIEAKIFSQTFAGIKTFK